MITRAIFLLCFLALLQSLWGLPLPVPDEGSDDSDGDSHKEVCHLPKMRGPCRGHFIRYFYNKDTGRCERFIYGGCHGNRNNFRSFHECNSYCHNK
ncbi:hypothetical protein ACROYT_G022625 [Oculina patagonica]